jgi:flagellar motor switch protein FliM
MPDAEKILSQHEVDALLSAIDTGAGEAKPAPSAIPYDFKRPARVPPDQMRALQALHEGFARSLQSALSGLLRTAVEAKLTVVQQLSLQEYLDTLPRPTALSLLSCEPLDGTFLLEINPAISFPMIERLLGSSRVGAWHQDKPLSALEWTVLDTIVARALELLKDAWSPLGPVAFRVTRRESDPARLTLENPNEAAISAVLELIVGDQRGCLNLAFPVVAVEGHLERLSPSASVAGKRRDSAPAPEGAISKSLAPAEVRLSAELERETIRLKDLEGLRPGDVLVTAHPASAPVHLAVEGRLKFQARLGRLKEHKAAKVLSSVGAGRDLPPSPPRPPLEVRKAEGGDGSSASAPPPAGFVENLLRLPLLASAVLAEKAMRLKDVLALRPGEIVTFPRRADEPLELRAARRALAHGVAVRVGERFGLRLTSILDPRERVRALGP